MEETVENKNKIMSLTLLLITGAAVQIGIDML